MQTYAECLASLFKEQHDKYHWKSSEIIIPVATSMTDSTSRLVNIADTIGFNKRTPLPLARNDQTCYWMSPQLGTNTKESRKNIFIRCLSKHVTKQGLKWCVNTTVTVVLFWWDAIDVYIIPNI